VAPTLREVTGIAIRASAVVGTVVPIVREVIGFAPELVLLLAQWCQL